MKSFASKYLSQQIKHKALINLVADENLATIIVIPAYNEPDILKCINSINECIAPKFPVEVIIVVNEHDTSSKEVINQNTKTIIELNDWKKNNSNSFLKFHIIRPEPFKYKHRGVGSARKIGMDEAVIRFNSINNPNGIIISLDADTTVDSNYLIEIEKLFFENKSLIGCTIKFHHRVEEITDLKHKEGIIIYERYLHFYKAALEYTGYPHALYTIGSAFACKINAYVKQGGMPRRQAGEDFYFLHKLSSMGKIAQLNSTCVYPSARISDRVPFGTGPSVQSWINGNNDIKLSYNLQSFIHLKYFFNSISILWENKEVKNLANSIINFLETENFHTRILPELLANSANYETFSKRFFQYFNAFKIIKFMNFSHPKYYNLYDFEESWSNLLKLSRNNL